MAFKRARLENWRPFGPFKPTELEGKCLVGNVYDHPNPRHFAGKEIKTSRVVKVSDDYTEVETRNTLYILGTPDPEWAEWKEVKNADPHSP